MSAQIEAACMIRCALLAVLLAPAAAGNAAGAVAAAGPIPGTWTDPLPGGPTLTLPVCDAREGGVGRCFIGANSSLTAVDAFTGATLWSVDLGTTTVAGLAVSVSAIEGESVIATAADGFVYRYTVDGALAWRTDTKRGGCPKDSIASRPVVQVRDRSNQAFQQAQAGDLVFVHTAYTHDSGTACDTASRNKVLALHLSDGSIAWTFNALGTAQVAAAFGSCSLSYVQNTLFCGSDAVVGFQNTLFALDTTSGARRWALGLDSIRSAPAVDELNGRLYVATHPSGGGAWSLLALDQATGATDWTRMTNGAPVSLDPTFEDHGGANLIVVDDAGVMYSYTDDGSAAVARFYSPFSLPSAIKAPPVLDPGALVVYLGRADGLVEQVEIIGGIDEATWSTGSDSLLGLALDADSPFGRATRLVAAAGFGLQNRWMRSGITWPFGSRDGPYPPGEEASGYTADLEIAAQGPVSAIPGQDIVDTFTVTNHGPSAATDPRVPIDLPQDARVESAAVSQGTFGTSTDGTTLAGLFGFIPSGGSASITVTIQAPVCIAPVTVAAQASSWEIDPTVPDTATLTTSVLATSGTTLLFTSDTTLSWSAEPAATRYDTYRGTIPVHGQGDRQPPGPAYDHTCFETNGGALTSTDPANPPLGTAYYYLVSEGADCGEGALGIDSNGTAVPNPSPCPIPPF